MLTLRPGLYSSIELRVSNFMRACQREETYLKSVVELLLWLNRQGNWLKPADKLARAQDMMRDVAEHFDQLHNQLLCECEGSQMDMQDILSREKGSAWDQMIHAELKDGVRHLANVCSFAHEVEEKLIEQIDYLQWLIERMFRIKNDAAATAQNNLKDAREMAMGIQVVKILYALALMHPTIRASLKSQAKKGQSTKACTSFMTEQTIIESDPVNEGELNLLGRGEKTEGEASKDDENVDDDDDKKGVVWPLFSYVVNHRLTTVPVNKGVHEKFLSNRLCFPHTRHQSLMNETIRFSIPRGRFTEVDERKERQRWDRPRGSTHPSRQVSKQARQRSMKTPRSIHDPDN